jgi:hypothetical protein
MRVQRSIVCELLESEPTEHRSLVVCLNLLLVCGVLLEVGLAHLPSLDALGKLGLLGELLQVICIVFKDYERVKIERKSVNYEFLLRLFLSR